MCTSYGFDQRFCPLVYTLQGDLVCEGSRFGEHLKEKYNISYNLSKDAIKSRQKENVANNELKMKERQEPTFAEVITKKILEEPPKNAVILIDDAFYHTEVDRSIPFYVRRTNMLRDTANKKFTARRTCNVPDLEFEKRQKEEAFIKAEEKRDKTWEEFLAIYQDHIEKKVDPAIRTANRKDADVVPP